MVGAQRRLVDRQRPAEQRLRLGISGTIVKVISGSIEQPRRLRDAQVLALDPTPGGQGVGHETFAPGPVRVFHVRKCPVQGLDGPFGEILAGRGGQLVEEHGLDEAVDGVGPGLGVAVHEGVAGQRGEELVERMVAAGRGGEGRGERLAEFGGPLQDQLVGDGVGGEEGAEAEQRVAAGDALATASKLRFQVVRTVSGYSPTTGPISSSNFSRSAR